KKMAKVHLIYFDLHTGYYPDFHHGLAYLIGSLQTEKHSVFLTHLKNESDYSHAIELVKREKPDAIGLSFTTNQKQYLRRFLDIADFSDMLIIGGGVHCTLIKEEIFAEFPEIDGICIGDGEASLKELCRRLDNNEDYFNTPGFYFKTEKGIIKNPILPLQNIESVPLPDYALFDYKKIIRESGDRFTMILSRGCPYGCYYCSNHALREAYPNKDKYVRLCPPDHAIKIIKNNLSLYPQTKKILFCDDTFTLDKKWLFDFCNLYRREINLPFFCNARIENIDDSVAECLKDAGCASVQFGVESGNEWLRAHILNRKHSNEKIKKAFVILKKRKIKTFAYNILGLPFETKEMQKDTLNLNFELWSNMGGGYYFYPYPKTRLYQLCLDYNLLPDKPDSKSGYLEGPCLKEIFISHKETIENFQILQLFFYSRLIFSKIKAPMMIEKLLFKMAVLLRKPIFFFCNPTGKNRIVVIMVNAMRKLGLRYLR
ncbi:MAG: radical SAM protein, partial [Candidatus Omnitrophota bacterium]|nr:radical SAM protein [Candidatus Omnitrophota bacterium]